MSTSGPSSSSITSSLAAVRTDIYRKYISRVLQLTPKLTFVVHLHSRSRGISYCSAPIEEVSGEVDVSSGET